MCGIVAYIGDKYAYCRGTLPAACRSPAPTTRLLYRCASRMRCRPTPELGEKRHRRVNLSGVVEPAEL